MLLQTPSKYTHGLLCTLLILADASSAVLAGTLCYCLDNYTFASSSSCLGCPVAGLVVIEIIAAISCMMGSSGIVCCDLPTSRNSAGTRH